MTEKRKVQVLTETTNWVKAPNIPNHTYFIDAYTKRLIAYVKAGTTELIRFSGKGYSFDRRYRSFDVKWRYI